MADTGFKYPTTTASTSEVPYDDDTWQNPSNIGADDGAEAYVTALTFDLPDYTYVLYAKGFDFSSIPSGATINGVEVEIGARSKAGWDSTLVVAQLTSTAGARGGTNKADGWYPATTEELHTLGGAADLWGNALTVAWVQDPDFGIGIVFQADDANADIYVDYIRMKVYYTSSAAFGKVNVAGTWKTVNKIQVNVGGVWKDVSSAKVNVGGVWKDLAS